MNDISFLHPYFTHKLNKLTEMCKEENIEFKIIDTYRTKQEQNYLYSQGRNSYGKICTQGMYPNNYHCWGLAVTIETEPDNIENIGRLAESIGLYLSDAYNSLTIEFHMETLKFLRLTYGEYKKFRLTWEPNYTQNMNTVITKPTMELASMNKKFIENIQMACNMDGFRARGRILSITGELDTDTMEALNNLKFEKNKSYSLIKRIQTMLSKIGFIIQVTGKYDYQTRQAISRLQIDNELTPNGQITQKVIVLILSKL